jgi:hypothetical protein
MTKTLIDTMWRGLEAKMAEVEAQAKRGRGTGTGSGAVKPPKFDGDYIMGQVLVPVGDRSRAQLLDNPGEIHISDHRLAGPCH